MSWIERVWFGSDPAASTARIALLPLSAAFGAITSARRALYNSGVFATHEAAIPCVSVGNLTVGGTGKTPFAAWLAARLQQHARAGVVLRGYGGDEAEVHRRLNPGIPVVALADRVLAVRMAKAAKVQVAVLDDAFQHRRVSRVADIVLLSVEQMLRPRRMLPAGPWREPLSAVRSATLVVLTRKTGTAEETRTAAEMVSAVAPGVPVTVVHLAPKALERANGKGSKPISSLNGADVRAVAAIGEPELFRRQLSELGARVSLVAFRDHHAFTAAEVNQLASGDTLMVCTLKDAVKLGVVWPASRELWYLSQQLVVEQGAEEIDRLCARVLERVSLATAD